MQQPLVLLLLDACPRPLPLNYGNHELGRGWCFASWNPLPGLCWLEEEKVWKALEMYEGERRIFVLALVQRY